MSTVSRNSSRRSLVASHVLANIAGELAQESSPVSRNLSRRSLVASHVLANIAVELAQESCTSTCRSPKRRDHVSTFTLEDVALQLRNVEPEVGELRPAIDGTAPGWQ